MLLFCLKWAPDDCRSRGNGRWYRDHTDNPLVVNARPTLPGLGPFILEGNIGKVIEKSIHSEMSGSPSRKPGVLSGAVDEMPGHAAFER